jgi:hypothetical protein
MKKRVISLLLSLVMLISACAFCLTSCSGAKTPEEEGAAGATNKKNAPTTLVMWCVTESAKTLNENGEPAFDEMTQEQMDDVVKKLTEITQSKLKTKLIVKYFTLEEYFAKLEEAFAWQEEEAIRKEEAKKNDKNNKGEKPKDEEPEVEEEEEDDGKIQYDEDGNPIIDTTKYPVLTEDEMKYQVDILYLAGYDKYTEYVANEWLAALNSELTGDAKKISNFVPAALLNAVRYKGNAYAIPNNNVIGEYTYMLINKELFDKYYYTASLKDVRSVVDLASFLEDIALYENDVLPINGDVNDCMGTIAHYWDIDPATNQLTGNFSILGYAYEKADKINRGELALKFDSLLANETYQNALKNLMEFQYRDYFGTPTEGQTSAVSFVTGDATEAADYQDDHYVVVVDYPGATDEDIYGNMFAVSKYSFDVNKAMQVVTLLNTDTTFRNLFQYGIENINYTLNTDGTVTPTRGNHYLMDAAKTGNEFLAYVPEGTNLEIWESAKLQNREATVSPLLGLDLLSQLSDDSDILNDPEAKKKDKYIIETIDKELLTYISDLSKDVWNQIEKCKVVDKDGKVDIEQSLDNLEKKMEALAEILNPEGDPKIKRAMSFEVVAPEFDEDCKIAVDENGAAIVANPTIEASCERFMREIVEKDEEGNEVITTKAYYVYHYSINPYQLYYRWMKAYNYLPAGFAG